MVSGMFSHAMPATWISGNLIKFQKAWTDSWLSSAEPLAALRVVEEVNECPWFQWARLQLSKGGINELTGRTHQRDRKQSSHLSGNPQMST